MNIPNINGWPCYPENPEERKLLDNKELNSDFYSWNKESQIKYMIARIILILRVRDTLKDIDEKTLKDIENLFQKFLSVYGNIYDENAECFYSAEQLKNLLDGRDSYIVQKGLWEDFVKSLSKLDKESKDE